MTDRLAELLMHTADQQTLGAVAPPMPPEWAPPVQVRARPAARWRAWAPVAAAAAAVAVAVPVVLVGQAAGPGSITAAGAAVAIDPAGGDIRSDDAGTPLVAGTPARSRGQEPCLSRDVRAVLDLAAGRLRVGLATKTTACSFDAAVQLELDGVAVEHLTQPDLPNPPSFEGRRLDADGVLLNTAWRGGCTLPEAGLLRGVGTEPVRVEVTGTPSGCSGEGAPVLEVGPAHREGSAGAIVPADRAGLRVALSLPERAQDAERVSYTVTLTNPTGAPVSLRPCPTYTYSLAIADGTGSSSRGRLPCEDLPVELAARSAVGLVGQLHLPALSSEGSSQAAVSWQIAGPVEATATTLVVRSEPRELTPVPYLAPDRGVAPAASGFRYRSTNGAFPIRIHGPSTATAGAVLRYRAVLTNPSGADPIPLRPCPGWTETLVLAPAVATSPTPAVRRSAVNCSQAPHSVGPGERIAFEMELTIPANAAAGPHQLFWAIDGGIDSEPFDLTVTP